MVTRLRQLDSEGEKNDTLRPTLSTPPPGLQRLALLAGVTALVARLGVFMMDCVILIDDSVVMVPEMDVW
jgi:hypothetical protein